MEQDPTDEPRIIGWTSEKPQRTRRTYWDRIFDEVRARDTDEYAVIERPGGKPFTNISHLRKKYPDLDIQSVNGRLHVRVDPEPIEPT